MDDVEEMKERMMVAILHNDVKAFNALLTPPVPPPRRMSSSSGTSVATDDDLRHLQHHEQVVRSLLTTSHAFGPGPSPRYNHELLRLMERLLADSLPALAPSVLQDLDGKLDVHLRTYRGHLIHVLAALGRTEMVDKVLLLFGGVEYEEEADWAVGAGLLAQSGQGSNWTLQGPRQTLAEVLFPCQVEEQEQNQEDLEGKGEWWQRKQITALDSLGRSPLLVAMLNHRFRTMAKLIHRMKEAVALCKLREKEQNLGRAFLVNQHNLFVRRRNNESPDTAPPPRCYYYVAQDSTWSASSRVCRDSKMADMEDEMRFRKVWLRIGDTSPMLHLFYRDRVSLRVWLHLPTVDCPNVLLDSGLLHHAVYLFGRQGVPLDSHGKTFLRYALKKCADINEVATLDLGGQEDPIDGTVVHFALASYVARLRGACSIHHGFYDNRRPRRTEDLAPTVLPTYATPRTSNFPSMPDSSNSSNSSSSDSDDSDDADDVGNANKDYPSPSNEAGEATNSEDSEEGGSPLIDLLKYLQARGADLRKPNSKGRAPFALLPPGADPALFNLLCPGDHNPPARRRRRRRQRQRNQDQGSSNEEGD